MTFAPRSFGITVAVAALLAPGLAGQAAAEPFRMVLTELTAPLVPNSIMEVAEALGYFEREGVDIEFTRVQQTPSALAALQSGEGDMANISVDALLQLVGRDQMPLKAVVSPNKALPFLIATQDSIAGPADLDGKSFGIGRIGSLDHSLSSKVLQTAGVDTDSLSWVAIGQPNVRAQALAAGQVDATTMSIGVWMSIPDRKGLHVIVDPDAYYTAAPVVQKVNVVTEEVLAERRDDIEGMVRGIIKASRDVAANPTIWVDEMVKLREDVPRTDLESLAETFVDSWSVNGGLNREELTFTADWVYQSEDFAGVPHVELAKWVDFTVIDEVLASIGKVDGEDQPVR